MENLLKEMEPSQETCYAGHSGAVCLGHIVMCVSVTILDWTLGNKFGHRFSCRKFIAYVFRKDICKVVQKAGLGKGRNPPELLC